MRSRQLAALSAWVLASARTQPLVLAFEDLHWADPTSLDVLQALAERGAQAPLLILATTRPEFHEIGDEPAAVAYETDEHGEPRFGNETLLKRGPFVNAYSSYHLA